MKKIRIINLITRIIRSWCLIGISVIIGLVLFCGYKYLLINSVNSIASIDELSEKAREDLESASVLEAEVVKYEEAAKKHRVHDQNLQNYFFGRIVYVVTGVDSSSNIVEDISRKLKSEETFEKLALELGEVDTVYLRSFVGVWNEVNENGDILFYYDYKDDNQANTERFVEVATPLMGEYGSQAISHYYNSTWDLVQSETFPIINNGDADYLHSAVIAFDEAHENAITAAKDAVNKLSSKEKLCYQKFYLNKSPSYTKREWIKFGLLGALAGAFVSVALIMIIYMFSNLVKTPEEITDIYGLPLIATIDYATKRTLVDKLLRKLEYRFDDEAYAIEAIKLQADGNALLLLEDDKNSIYYSYLQDNISGLQGIAICDYLNRDMLDNKVLSQLNGVILVVGVNKTNYLSLDRVIEACKRQNVKILGTLAIA